MFFIDIALRLLPQLQKFDFLFKEPLSFFEKKKSQSIVEKYFIGEIEKYLKKADRSFKVSDNSELLDLIKHSSLRGLILDIFRDNSFYPSPKDYAVAINVAAGIYHDNNNEHKRAAINLSYKLADKIKELIRIDEHTNEIFTKLGKEIDRLVTNTSRQEIED
jgi:hypothetical protein